MAERKPRKNQRIPPRCKAIILCESILIEAETNSISIVRIFKSLLFESLPDSTVPFFVFTELIGGIGSYELEIEIHDLQNDLVVASIEWSIEFTDRLLSQHLMISVPPLHLEHAGAYDVVMLADGCEVDRQQFIAILSEGENNGEETDEGESQEDP